MNMPAYKTDLSKLPVLFQGYQPCCVEAALTAAVEYYYLMKTGTYTPLSFRFLAALTAAKDGINYVQGGTSLEVAFEVAKTVGICTADTYPNDIAISPTEFVELPLIPQEAYAEAANFKIPGYQMLTDLTWDTLNQAIQANKLVLTALYLDKDWYLSNVPNSNPLPLPPPMGMTDPSLSKHMTLSYGFDTNYRYVRNSFGNTFGENGDGYYGPDYQPYIFGAGVILDPIFQTVAEDVQELATEVQNIQPTEPTAPQQESLAQEVIEDVEKIIEAI